MSSVEWHITCWDRARGRGTIACPQLGELEFDASVAVVDDFAVGEGVHVELAPKGSSFQVTRIWPDDPRLPNQVTRLDALPLQPTIASRVDSVLASYRVHNDYRIEHLEDDLVVSADDTGFAYGWDAELVFNGVEYLELPCTWSGKTFRLANAKERSYLASRCDLRSDSVAIKIVDDTLRLYFVVCADFTVRGGRRAT